MCVCFYTESHSPCKEPSYYIHRFFSESWQLPLFLVFSYQLVLISVPFVNLGVCTLATSVSVVPSLNFPELLHSNVPYPFRTLPIQAIQHLPKLVSDVYPGPIYPHSVMTAEVCGISFSEKRGCGCVDSPKISLIGDHSVFRSFLLKAMECQTFFGTKF